MDINELKQKIAEIKSMPVPSEDKTVGEVYRDIKHRLKETEAIFDTAIDNAPKGLAIVFKVLKGVTIGHLVAIAAWLREMDQEMVLHRSGQDFESYSKMCGEEFDLKSFQKPVEERLSMDDPFAHVLMGREANG